MVGRVVLAAVLLLFGRRRGGRVFSTADSSLPQTKSEPAPERPWLIRSAEWQAALRSTVINVVLVLALVGGPIVLGIVKLGGYGRDTFTIEVAEAPEEAVKRGLTRDVFALMLRDRVSAIAESAHPDRAPKPIWLGLPKLDFTVPGTGVSFRSVADTGLGWAGLGGARFTGTLISAKTPPDHDDVYRLVIRDGSRQFFDRIGTLDELLQRGGLAILQEADPYVAASYLINNASDPDASLEFIYRLVAKAEAEEAAHTARGSMSEVPWAYLAWAYALQSQERWAAAASKFEHADALYRNRNPGKDGWDVALDGWGHALLHMPSTAAASDSHVEEAERLLTRVVASLNHRSVSAYYHLGKLYQERLDDFCRAASAFENATKVDPRYALAWEGWGTVLLGQATRIRYSPERVQSCSAPNMPNELRPVEIMAEEKLSKALIQDPAHGPAWLQYGILLFQQGDLDGAAAKLGQATRRNRSDAYGWYRLGQVRHQLANHAPAALKGVAEAFCRAVELRPDVADYRRELGAALIAITDDRFCLTLTPLFYRGTINGAPAPSP